MIVEKWLILTVSESYQPLYRSFERGTSSARGRSICLFFFFFKFISYEQYLQKRYGKKRGIINDVMKYPRRQHTEPDRFLNTLPKHLYLFIYF